jgi:hypothetical protein
MSEKTFLQSFLRIFMTFLQRDKEYSRMKEEISGEVFSSNVMVLMENVKFEGRKIF